MVTTFFASQLVILVNERNMNLLFILNLMHIFFRLLRHHYQEEPFSCLINKISVLMRLLEPLLVQEIISFIGALNWI